MMLTAAACILMWGQVPVGSGKPTALTVTTPVERLITSFDEEKLERILPTLPAGSERDLAAGVVASRTGHLTTGATLLRRVLRAKPARQFRQAIALEYLALDAALQNNYASAAKFGRELLAARGSALHGNDLVDFQEQAAGWEILKLTPPQVVERPGPTTLALRANKTGRIEAPLLANGVAAVGLFDTGASMSVMSQSLARRLGLTPLSGKAHIVGSSGVASVVQLALIDQLTLGAAILRHVPVTILADSTLLVGPPGQQSPLDMIIGYPVLRALRTYAVTRGGRLILGGARPAGRLTGRLVERGPTSILLTRVAGKPANFLLDTGANKTILTTAFYQRHAQVFGQKEATTQQFTGIGGTARTPRYTLPSLKLTLKMGSVLLQHVSVLPGASALDVAGLVGNLGRDVGATSDELTLDFVHGELRLK